MYVFLGFLTTSSEHLFRRAPFDGCLWQYIEGKTGCNFLANFNPLKKTVCAPVYSLFEILSNENSFKQFVANSLLPDCKEGYYKEGGFYNKYLHWSCRKHLENIGSVFNTKLSALTPLPISGVNGLWTISFFVKS